MIVASFSGADSLVHAVRRLREAGVTTETRTAIALPGDEGGGSRIATAVLCAGALGAAAGFGMQCYASMVAYPQLIGGRPDFFWTSFIVYAFECGLLAATLTAFLGFLIANRMPELYQAADESDLLRQATSDGWFLVAHGQDMEVRRLLRGLGPLRVEQVQS